MPSLARRAVAEMFGTALFIFFGCAVVIMEPFPHARFGVFGIAATHAFALALLISMTMGVSGGHLNPAVTIGLAAIRRISPLDAFVYVVSQLAGALVGAAAVRTLMSYSVGSVVGFGTPMLAEGLTITQACTLEAIFAFMLMSGVMATAVARNAPKIAGFGIGLTLIPIIMVGGPLTGGVANPARAFGPAVITGNMTAQAVWWIGPIIGAVLAALLWNYVLLGRDEAAA
ncbi:MAG TPA: aquaporin [Gemmatimonadales bacterium]|jgi:aquaporin Z|nr:aquaporin [Gemmatimonadales bacterium]